MRYSKFFKIIKNKFPNLIVLRPTVRTIEVYVEHKYDLYRYRSFLVSLYFKSYRKVKVIQHNFYGYEEVWINSKDFYKVLQIINETFINVKNIYNVIGS